MSDAVLGGRLKLLLAAAALGVVLATLAPIATGADNGTIAFQGFRRGADQSTAVFTMAADGRGVRRLGPGEQPSISRDGKRIVFVKEAGENGRYREVFVMDSVGTDVRRLTDDKSVDSQPTISPDGKEVAFVSDDETGKEPEGEQIFLMTISGSDPVQLTQKLPFGGTNTEPSFSPNGNRIVFVHIGPEGAEIESMNTDGGDRTVLGKGDAFVNPSHPSYSPDGRRIVFQADAKVGGQTNVYTFSSDKGLDLDKVNKGQTTALEPAYSPNGRGIVFRRGVNLFSMTPEGTDVEQLTDLDPGQGSNSSAGWGR